MIEPSEPLAASEPAASPGPGARLKGQRERRGLAIAAVADALHVAPRLIVALEADDFAAFDAPVYARGFLRKYAAYLELPVEEVLSGYEARARDAADPTLIPALNVAPTRRPLPDLPLVPLAAAAVLLLAGAGGYWWWSARARQAPAPAVVAATPERAAPAAAET
ncbi:MAG: helix-turn-helix domain-containing protein, partial [Proteobacteria bacterium]|nr:helix-turn-helix domain-containing protein [Pseudomonadota bacterium]